MELAYSQYTYDDASATGQGHDEGPVVVLHGLFGSGKNWQTLCKRMALGVRWDDPGSLKQPRVGGSDVADASVAASASLASADNVLALDMRNHGQSPHSDTHTLHAMVEDVRGFLDRHGIERARVVGHSMGGKVATCLALAHPERVSRLCVVDIAPVEYRYNPLGDDLAGFIRAMRDVDLSAVKSKAEADALLRDAVPDAIIRAFLLTNLVRVPRQRDGAPTAPSAAAFEWRVNLPVLYDALAGLARFDCANGARPYTGPAKLIGGARSKYIQQKNHSDIFRLLPATARAADGITMIPNAGHWVHSEKSQEFLAALMPFLNERHT